MLKALLSVFSILYLQHDSGSYIRPRRPPCHSLRCIRRSLMYHFIPDEVCRGKKKTKRQRELQIADARRHAANVVADRRRRNEHALTEEVSSKASSPKAESVISLNAVDEPATSCPSSHSPWQFCSACRTLDSTSSPDSSEAATPAPSVVCLS